MSTATESPLEKYLTPIAVLLGALIIALAFAFGGGDRPAGDDTGTASNVDIKDVQTDGAPFIGSVTAPVTVAVWYDFQCGYCKRFEASTLADVEKEFVDSGKVKIVYKDFQFLGQASLDTAVYSRAVWDAAPTLWSTWFKQVMAGEGEATLTTAGLDAVSTAVGIDAARISTLIKEKGAEYKAAIEADRAEGQSFGITGTPGSIIGTTLVGGAQPYLATGRSNEQPVKPLIEAELAK